MRAIYQCGESNPCGWKVELSEDNAELKQRIAQLEAQIESAHRVIDTFGLSRCGDSHEGRDANGCVTCDDGKPPLSLAERTKWLIDMMPHDSGEELVALTRERAAARQSRARLVRLVRALHSRHAQDVSDELVTALTERDAAEDRVRVLEAQLSETHRKIANQRDANRRLTEEAHRRKAELAALRSVAHTEARNWTLTANRLIAARQSRARLVWLVRVLRAELTSAWGIEEQAEQELNAAMTARDVALSARDEIEGLYEGMQWERDQYITKATYWRQKAESEQKGTEVAYELWDAAQAERDAARAWAAAWKRAATFWRGWRDMPYTYCRDRDFVFGGARRAVEAAEAQERR